MTRPPGEGRARPVVTAGGKWAGKPPYDTVENWVAHIARLSTPVREFGPDGGFLPWIENPLRSSGEPAQAIVPVPHAGTVRRTGSPDVLRGPSRVSSGG